MSRKCTGPPCAEVSIDQLKSYISLGMREDLLERMFKQLFENLGWIGHHGRPAWDKKTKKCTTPIMGLKGFVDWVIARRGDFYFVELKAEHGVLSLEQKIWRAALEPSGRYRLWKPSDWLSGEIERELT